MEDTWDEPSSKPTTESFEPKSTGFGGFTRNNDSENKSSGFGGREGFGGERREGGFGGERREGGFGGRGGGHGGGFGSRNNEDGEKREGGFQRREGGERREGGFGGEKREGGFGGRVGGFGSRNNEDGEKKEGGFQRREGGFGGERREGGFGGERREGGGERREGGFGGRGGGRGGGFGSRNEDGERKEGGFRREGGFGSRKEGEEGERKEGGFQRREGGFGGRGGGDGEEGGERRERRERKEDDGENGEVKRERYIPTEVEDTEENLFHTINAGVNFEKQSEIAVSVTGTGSEEIKPLSKFEDAKLSDLLLSNVQKSNYKTPTPVQKYGIPIILQNRDLMACAQTGSGKTAAYVLPIMTNILRDGIQSSAFSSVQEPQALILSPTRELAMQIFQECKKFSYGSIIKSGILYGGVDTGFQLSNLSKGCNILVATPGRLLDVLEKQKISLAKVKYFVLDEADRMLDMGFEKTVRDILEKGTIQAKGERVTLMFSATFPKEIQQLAQDFLNDYLFLTVGVVGGANADVTQVLHKVTRLEKREKVIEILNEIGKDKCMIFLEHKKQADILAFYLIQKGYPTTSLHGDRLQSQREEALRDFKSGKSNIIVCTSVAARGLDIENVNHVINLDLPQTIDEYVHRIGRTGRCGNTGQAISLFDPANDNDMKLARPLARILAGATQVVPEWLSELAEDSVGSSFGGKNCTDDLRGKLDAVKITSTAAEEEEW